MTEKEKTSPVDPVPQQKDPDPNPPEKGEEMGGNKGKNVLEVKAEKTEKEQVLEKIQGILAEHNGLESNIPLTSEYWDLLNTYRRLQ